MSDLWTSALSQRLGGLRLHLVASKRMLGFTITTSSHSEAQIIKTGLGVKLLVVYYSTINLVAEFISRKKSTLLVL